jgi:hypothetical protein
LAELGKLVAELLRKLGHRQRPEATNNRRRKRSRREGRHCAFAGRRTGRAGCAKGPLTWRTHPSDLDFPVEIRELSDRPWSLWFQSLHTTSRPGCRTPGRYFYLCPETCEPSLAQVVTFQACRRGQQQGERSFLASQGLRRNWFLYPYMWG